MTLFIFLDKHDPTSESVFRIVVPTGFEGCMRFVTATDIITSEITVIHHRSIATTTHAMFEVTTAGNLTFHRYVYIIRFLHYKRYFPQLDGHLFLRPIKHENHPS